MADYEGLMAFEATRQSKAIYLCYCKRADPVDTSPVTDRRDIRQTRRRRLIDCKRSAK